MSDAMFTNDEARNDSILCVTRTADRRVVQGIAALRRNASANVRSHIEETPDNPTPSDIPLGSPPECAPHSSS